MRAVLGRQRRASDVLDVGAETQRVGGSASSELCEPARIANLATMALAILQDLDRTQRPLSVDAHGVGDEVLATDDLVDKNVTEGFIAAFCRPGM